MKNSPPGRVGLVLAGLLLVAFAGGVAWFFLDDTPPQSVAPSPALAAPTIVAPAQPRTEIDEPPAVWPAGAPRILSGTVSDPDGAPIRGAAVRVEMKDRLAAQGRTDAKGTYRLEQVPARPARIVVKALGYLAHEDLKPKFPAGRDVRWDVTLKAVLGVRGLVQAGGRPVADAYVSMHRDGTRRPIRHGKTDAGGRFFMNWPQQGATAVMARHGQHGEATTLVDGPGDVIIDLPGGGYIEGTVIDWRGGPVENFSISASPLLRGVGGPPAQSFSSADGVFKLGPLAPGKMEIWAAAENFQPTERRGLEVKTGETVSDIVLKLRASVVLVGQVTDSQTRRPIEGAQVIPAEWRSGALAESVGTYTDEDGRYRLTALPGSRTSIRVKAEGYRSVLAGGVEGAPNAEIRRDFGLNPQRKDQVPATELTGIGAVLRPHPDGVRLGRIMPDGPASEVLQAGDIVVAVDGEPIRGNEMGKVAQAIRGEEGSEVELMIRRGGADVPEAVVLTRGRVTIPDRNHRRRPRPRPRN